ncbi:HNH endonuclease [Burkholderia multivorans]|uniref:HNH endonuclease n=1 Tax=Burkholderia multivorans TaxID=87883 RepID=UPI000CFECA9D|nr:HNH endonuclease [Burkholderia multivorans]MDN7445926.1 HNH endonuclease [Burkholderia multivorans]PRD80474.1 hypothetical protein C6P76_29305 [Burkholderia multivorans]
MDLRFGSVCSGIEAASVDFDAFPRFWSKVDRRGPDECWLWTAAIHSSGYGKFGAGGKYGKTLLAHRVSYEIANGSVPDGLWVLHRCDVRLCCNPKHLFAGTPLDNVVDMMDKGRFRGYDKSGEANPAARLRKEQVIEIRQLLAVGTSQKAIAERFDISRQLVSAIKCGEVWQ